MGLHWFNPVPVMKLVELIRPLQAQDEVVDRAKLFAEACGKTVCTSADAPGSAGHPAVYTHTPLQANLNVVVLPFCAALWEIESSFP